ncbi:transposase [Magnetococcales bacterium HHB-1]
MPKKRKHFSPQEKTAILREHLINNVPVSNLCDQYGIHPTLFYRWQKKMFEGLPKVFEGKQTREVSNLRKENEKLRERLTHKDTVIAQIMEDFIAAKKSYEDL